MLNRVFKAFQYRDFRLMWIGACTSSIGSWMQIMAQAWLIYGLSHNSAFLLGLDAFLGSIPIFLFSLVGGVMADRFDRRHVLLVSQYIQMADASILTVLVFTHTVHVWQVLLLSFISGLRQAFGGPAYQALIPTLVKKRGYAQRHRPQLHPVQCGAHHRSDAGRTGDGPLGNAWCFGLNALSFLAPVVTLIMVKTRFSPEKTTDSF